MKKVLTKIGNFFATFLFPRKMANYTRMSLFFGFLLFICCLMVSYASSNIKAKDYVTDLYGDLFFVDNRKHDYKLTDGSTDLPKLELVKDTAGNYHYAICESLPIIDGTPKHIFDYTLKDAKNERSTLFLKVVYELEYYEDKPISDPKIPERFQGTYLIYEGENRHIIEVIGDGKGYYDGKKANFNFTSDTNSIKSETDKLMVEIKISEENNYEINVKVENTPLTIQKIERLFSSSVLKNFDLYSYLQEAVELGSNEDELLIIFTRTLVYPLYNRGKAPLDGQKNFNYLETTSKKGEPTHPIYNYYLPSDLDDVNNPMTWTEKSSYGKKKEIGGTEYVAFPKELIPSLAEIFAYNTPILSYEYAQSAKVDVLNVKADVLVKTLTNYLIESWSSSAKYQNSCVAGTPFGFILPLLCVCITWLMSRKKGVLKTFKEYFNLAALTYVLPAVLCFILGFFFQYTQFVYFTLLFQLGFFILAAYRINTMPQETYTSGGTNSSNRTLTIDSTTDTGEKVESKEEEMVEESKDNDSANLIG